MIEGIKGSVREEYKRPVQTSRLSGRVPRKGEVKDRSKSIYRKFKKRQNYAVRHQDDGYLCLGEATGRSMRELWGAGGILLLKMGLVCKNSSNCSLTHNLLNASYMSIKAI